jgi:hypothetical protein
VALVSLLIFVELVRLRPHSVEDMRPINELRMAARWKLGRALAKVERATHPGKGKVASGGRERGAGTTLSSANFSQRSSIIGSRDGRLRGPAFFSGRAALAFGWERPRAPRTTRSLNLKLIWRGSRGVEQQ